jgi:hypothetical protein
MTRLRACVTWFAYLYLLAAYSVAGGWLITVMPEDDRAAVGVFVFVVGLVLIGWINARMCGIYNKPPYRKIGSGGGPEVMR